MKLKLLFLAILALSCYLQSCQPSFEPVNYEYSSLQPPLEQVNQAAETIKINPAQPKVVHLKNGSSLSIPKAAFVDAAGNTITGEVELQYRQFDNAAQIIASGIPMTYQAADGQQQQLQSGGMFELKGTANGKPVFIAPDKSIQTSLASQQLGDYDFYYLNPAAKNEQYNWEKLTNQVDIADSKKGVATFELQYDIATTPEIAALQGIQWQLADKEAAFDPNQADNNWVLEEKWLNATLSQPQYKVNQLHFINNKEDGNAKLTTDDLIEIEGYSYDGNLYQYDWEGKQLSEKAKDGRVPLSEEVYYDIKDSEMIITNKQGKAIKKPDNFYKFDVNEETHQIAYSTFNESDDPVTYDLVITDKTGKVQHTAKDLKEGADTYYPVYVDARPKHIIIYSFDVLKIYTWEGKLLHKFEDIENYTLRGLSLYGKENYLVLLRGEKEDEENGNSIVLWDFAANKMLTPPTDYKAYPNHYTYEIFPDKGLFLYKSPDNEKGYIWNFKKNTIKAVEQTNFKVFDQLPQYLAGKSRDGKYAFFDFDGNLKIAFDGIAVGRDLSFGISEDGERIVTMFTDGESKLYNSDFEVLKDFRTHDQEMQAAFFTPENTIVTYNLKGQYFIWDYAGNLKKEGQFDCQDCYLSLAPFDSTLFFSLDKNKQFKIWSPSGDLVYHFNNQYPFIANPAATNQLLLKGGKYNADTLSPFVIADVAEQIKDKDVYQLAVHSKTRTYYTYVYLDAATKRAYDNYQVAVQKKLQKQAETAALTQKVTRSFAIKNFGIYNWDKFYKMDEETLVKCEAKFNLPEIKNSAATLFLITGENRNTVIQYTPDTWDKFSFQPNLYNQLLAILPDGEIAVFSNAAFQKLDANKIRAAGSHTFLMEKKGGVAALDELEKIMQINETAAL